MWYALIGVGIFMALVLAFSYHINNKNLIHRDYDDC